MDWDRIEGGWKELSGHVKAQWSKLTDDDIKKIAGKRAQLESRIASRYGYEKAQVARNADRSAFEHGDKG